VEDGGWGMGGRAELGGLKVWGGVRDEEKSSRRTSSRPSSVLSAMPHRCGNDVVSIDQRVDTQGGFIPRREVVGLRAWRSRPPGNEFSWRNASKKVYETLFISHCQGHRVLYILIQG
jgi:hypothetical protein